MVSQMFHPDGAATAKVMGDIATSLVSEGFSVEVICQDRSYLDPSQKYTEYEDWKGVKINRVKLPKLDKNSLLQRILLLFLFSIGAYRKLKDTEGELFFAVSNPPWMGFLVSRIAKRKKKPFVFVVHDLYPDVLAKLGKVSERSPIFMFSKFITGKTLGSSDKTIVLGREAKEYLADHYGLEDGRIEVITNWGPDISENDKGTGSESLGFDPEIFRVVYSGNIGETADMEILVSTARLCLQHSEDIEFLVIGSGKKRAWVEKQVRAFKLDNLKLYGFLPEKKHREALNSASALFVSLEKNLKGISVPSKTYSYLSAGKPILALVPEGSEIALAIEEDDFGLVVPYNAEAFTEAILSLKKDRELFARKSANAKRVFKEKYNCSAVISRFSELFRSLIKERSGKY